MTSELDVAVFASHMDYFGYTSELHEDGNGFRAEHEFYGSVFVRAWGQGVLVSTYWFISDDASRNDVELLAIMNDINLSSLFSKFSVNEDDALQVDAYFSGEYSQITFGEFLDGFQQDNVRVLKDNTAFKNYKTQQKLSSVN